MKRIWISVVAVALLSVAALAPAAAQDTVTIDMHEVDESGQSGSADITSDGDQSIVSIEIDPGEEGVPQPVHIHEGSCQDLGDVAYPLEDVVDGVSESAADVSLSDLIAGEYAINVHLSEDEIGVNVACGTLPLIAPAPEEEDDAVEEDDEVVEEDDEVVEEDDEVVEEDDEVVEDDDAVVEDDEADDAEEVVPAAGSTGGFGPELAILMMTLAGGAALGAGLLVRRRAVQV